MSTDPVVSAAADTYATQPLNADYKTPDDEKIRTTARDSFIAGVMFTITHPDWADTFAVAAADYAGTGNHILHMEMLDGFIAGVAWIMGHPDEYQRLRKEWP